MERLKFTTYVSYPVNDCKRHNKLSVNCDCKPESEIIGDELYICHNAFDKREILEKMDLIITPQKRWILEKYEIQKVDDE